MEPVTIRWYNRLTGYVIVKALIPGYLVKSNDEIIGLKEELQKLKPMFQRISVPTVVVQGDEDSLVEPANADYARLMLTNSPVTIRWINNYGHLIPFSRPEAAVAAILEVGADESRRSYQSSRLNWEMASGNPGHSP